MAQKFINIGSTPNDGTGDKLRDGFHKVNQNDTELYAKDANLQSQIDSLGTDVDRLFFEVTIGTTGADFSTFKEAYDAGNRIINAINDTVEVGSTLVDEGFYLYVNTGVTCDFSSFKLSATAGGVTFNKQGEGDVVYASTVANEVFFDDDSNPDCTFIFKGGKFKNQSTANGCRITNADNQRISAEAIELPDFAFCGIRFLTSNCFIKDTNFVGGGSSCYGAIHQENGIVQGLSFTGTFDDSTGNYIIEKYGSEGFLENVTLAIGGTANSLFSGGIQRNVTAQDGNSVLNIFLWDSEGTFENFTLNGGVFDLDGTDRHILTNIKFAKFENSNSSDCVLSNVVIDPNTLNLAFSSSKIDNCRLSLAGDIDFTGNDLIVDSLTLTNGSIRVLGNRNTLDKSYANVITVGADLADATIPPPTEVLGDQYYLDPTAGPPVDPAWDGNSKGDTVEFDGAVWVAINTPTNTICTGNRTTSGSIIDNGDNTGITNTSFT